MYSLPVCRTIRCAGELDMLTRTTEIDAKIFSLLRHREGSGRALAIRRRCTSDKTAPLVAQAPHEMTVHKLSAWAEHLLMERFTGVRNFCISDTSTFQNAGSCMVTGVLTFRKIPSLLRHLPSALPQPYLW